MILMNDFKAEPEALREAMHAAAAEVFESGWYVLGTQVEAFERQWAETCEVAHCIGVGNGLDALEICLRALGIGQGDEVITTSMTAFATVLAIIRAGATPVFADINPDTAMLAPQSVQRCISPRTKAVLLVHLYGQAGPLDELIAMAHDGGFHLIEDCAQAHLAHYNGQPVGSFGTCAAWSFYPTKNLGAIGDGGAVTTSALEVAAQARALRNYGQSARYHHPSLGLNSRLDELQAALLRVRLPYLLAWTARRREIAQAYQAAMSNPKVRLLPLPAMAERHVHHLFVVTSAERDALQAHLLGKGVATLIHYPIAAHLQPPGQALACDPLGLSQTEQHAASCLSLPCHPALGDDEVALVIDAVNAF